MHVRGCSVHPSGVPHTGGAGRVASACLVSASDGKPCFPPREHPGSIGGKSRGCLGVAPRWTPDAYAGAGWYLASAPSELWALDPVPRFSPALPQLVAGGGVPGTQLLLGALPDSAILLVGWYSVGLAARGGGSGSLPAGREA